MNAMLISHEFVELMPQTLEQSTLYISIPYATAIHLCACGCGTKVVTPISPPEWRLTWDGDTVSLYPSVGNWQFPCRSHYWIRRNRIIWAGDMTDAEVAEARTRDARELAAYFGESPSAAEGTPVPPTANPSMLRKLRQLLGSRRYGG